MIHAVEDVMERCNRQLAVVIDAADPKHALPKYKLLTRRRIFSRFCMEEINCLLLPKISTKCVLQPPGSPKIISTGHPQ